ncbi:cation diffusion facilitator family transporter [Lancefieldella rimae]|uniref:cation diffusion facilitator family transporter n=1 Tax=Lancefieldella rimae TaxID=1383 RepID=UPI00287FFABA|nr:cation diffusion facilitator family transporter [Lancefieldella rimae]
MNDSQAQPQTEPKTDHMASREKIIVQTSIIGIAANVALAAFKAVVGLLSNSIAVILDAVNNLSDAISSIITIAGTKLSNRAADREHPFGHGRIEYITTTVIAAIIMYAGISSLIESVKGILNPETPEYSTTSLVIIAVAVVVKIVLGRFVQARGRRVHSDTLIASGSDALFDAILSTSVFTAALIFTFTKISLEAYVGVVISGFIIKASVEMLRGSMKEIIGMRADSELSIRVAEIVANDPEAEGVYDLILHSYGPDRYVGSFHTEISDQMTATEIDSMTRRLTSEIYDQTDGQIIIAAIGIYARNTQDNTVIGMRTEITKIAMQHDGVIQVHGFTANIDEKYVAFDMVVEFGFDSEALMYHIMQDISEKYPDFSLNIKIDRDTSDLASMSCVLDADPNKK